ncbi:MAG: thermonuclease family protein [Clostridiales bacterium]|nr:thermonuclease family protein [Clostridiales bacterium]
MKKLLSVMFVFLLVLTVVFAACDKVADNTEFYDKITKSLKFNLNYEGKSFLTDGVGVARVDAYTDGDTTRFYTEKDGTVNIRYFCIDTPESTSKVEKWGKAASNFVHDRLSQATVIVLESSTGKAATKDSYGTRYLGYVWYKTATEDFKLLNLEIVENGFSLNKGNSTSAYKYNSYFVKAENFARSIQLRWFSKKADPLFNNDPVEFSIKDFTNNIELYYDEENGVGAKVIFEAYLIDLSVSDSGTHNFIAAQYDAETGKQYTINVYAGYNSSYASNMTVGNYYKFVGSLQKYGSAFQISDITYSEIFDGLSTTFLRKANYYLMFDSSNSKANLEQYAGNVYSNVSVTKVEAVANGVLTFEGTATLIKPSGTDAKTFTFKLAVDDDFDVSSITVGAILRLNGLQLTAGEITVLEII